MRAAFARARGEHTFHPQGITGQEHSTHLHGIRFPTLAPSSVERCESRTSNFSARVRPPTLDATPATGTTSALGEMVRLNLTGA